MYNNSGAPVVKVKSPAYVAAHKLRGECTPTPKRIAGMVVTNETSEYLSIFPEDTQMFQPYIDAQVEMVNSMISKFTEADKNESQKEFALAVKDDVYSCVLFQARTKAQSPLCVWSALNEALKVKILLNFMES